MSTPRKIFKNHRNVNTRTEGLMRKAAVLQKFGARVVVYIEMEGERAMFKSDKGVNVPDYGVCTYGPDHFKFAAGSEPRSPATMTASRGTPDTTFPSTPSHTATKPSRAIGLFRQNPVIPHPPISRKAMKPLSFFQLGGKLGLAFIALCSS